jgi:hypothetical protein
MPETRVRQLIRSGIDLVNAVADGAGDEEITPSEIAEMIRDALEEVGPEGDPRLRRFLNEALDAVSDGMPADYVAMSLYAALGAMQKG